MCFMCLLWLTSWTSGPHGYFCSGSQVDVVATLNVYRTSARTGANDGANCSTLAATGNCANDRAHRRTDRRACDCLVGLIAFANRTFLAHTNDVAIRRTDRFENAGEAIASTVSQTNRVEVESHVGTT